jgi:hypothetical protein
MVGLSVMVALTYIAIFSVGSAILAAANWRAAAARRRRRLLSDWHVQELYTMLERALRVVQTVTADTEPSMDDGTLFVTGASVTVRVESWLIDDDRRRVRVTFHQFSAPLGKGICSRFAFLLLTMLDDPSLRCAGHYVHVRELSVTFEVQRAFDTRAFREGYGDYLSGYRRIRFRHALTEPELSDWAPTTTSG